MSALPEESPDSSIVMRSARGGPCRVFLVQTRNRAEASQIHQLFQEMGHHCSIRVLADGVTSAFAVQSPDDEAMLRDVETHLKEYYKFSVVYAGFNAVIHRIVEDLAVETGSRLHPVPVCRACGDVEPFPVRLTLRGPGGKRRASAVFCDRCLSRAEAEGGDAYLGRLIDSSMASLQPPTPVVRKRVLLRAGLGRRKSRIGKSKTAPNTVTPKTGAPKDGTPNTGPVGDVRLAG